MPRPSLGVAALAPTVVAAVLMLSVPGAEAVGAGEPAPAVEWPSDDGAIGLAAQRGRVVYLDFWASWCGPCRRSFPWMNTMQDRYGAEGLTVIAVNVDARTPDARRFLADHPARFRVAWDPAGDTARRFAVRAMPSSVLIGADGRVIAVHTGFRDSDANALEAGIRDALARRRDIVVAR